MRTRALYRRRYLPASPARKPPTLPELAVIGAQRQLKLARQRERLCRQLGESEEAETYRETAEHLKKTIAAIEADSGAFDYSIHKHLVEEGRKK